MSSPRRAGDGRRVLPRAVAVAAALAVAIAAGPAAAAPAQQPGRPAGPVLSWVGDIAFSARAGLPPGGVGAAFAPVAHLLRDADLTLGNLEGTLGRGGGSKCAGGRSNCFAFQAPASLATALFRAGFGLLNLANNHSHDFGESGLRQTKAALARAGIAHTGLAGEITVRRVAGTPVAFVGFAPYPWASPLTDIPAARRQVAAAARRAKIVVVIIHAGAEGAGAVHVPLGTETAFGENRGQTRRFAHAVVDAGADAVLGSGPHVLRGMECYRRRLIAYSLGNFASFHTLSTAGVLDLSGILRLGLGPTGALAQARLFPVRLTPEGLPRRDGSRGAIRLVQRLSREDFGRRACRIASDGTVTAP